METVAKELNVGVGELFEENGPVAIQHNQQGQNVNVLYQQSQWEKTEKLYEELLKAKDDLIKTLQQRLEERRNEE
ncbi:MAG: hypothetical protein ACK4GN_01225 [Runella sp.]